MLVGEKRSHVLHLLRIHARGDAFASSAVTATSQFAGGRAGAFVFRWRVSPPPLSHPPQVIILVLESFAVGAG